MDNNMVDAITKGGQGTTRSAITWNVFYVFLFFYRVMYSILGHVVVMRLTSIGDTESYQQAGVASHLKRFLSGDGLLALAEVGEFQGSTFVTDWIGSQFSTLFGGEPILVNIGFQSIAFIGLLYLLKSVPPGPRKGLSFLVMLPSFSLWTSIASKECIVVFALAIVSGYLVRQYIRATSLNLAHILAVLLLYIFKPQYLIAICYAWAARTLGGYVRQKALLAYLGLLASFSGLVVFREKIDQLAVKVQWSFEVVADVRSTRLEPFFVEKYDVFMKIPEGFYLAFMGPTIEEASRTPLHMVTYAESLLLLAALVLSLVRRFRDIPLYNFIVGIGVSFWIMFPNYPFGVMNPGSAIRYRSGWIILVFVAITVLSSRELFLMWRQQQTNRSSKRKILTASE